MDRSEEYKMLVEILEKEDAEAIINNIGASMVLNKDKVIAVTSTEGVKISSNKIEDGIEALVEIKDNYIAENPVHLCFGMLPKEGKQIIKTKIIVGKNAKVKIISDCVFPNAVHIEHIMEGEVLIKEGGELTYQEEHFHSDDGFVEVVPVQKAVVEKGGKFFNHFYMKKGRVGKLDIDYKVTLMEKARAELTTKIYGKGTDKISTRESIALRGEYSSGLILSRVVLKDQATSEFYGETEGFAPNTRAHVDCSEIIMDEATASAIPKIHSHHPSSKLTHEAAIGQIDETQLQTLLAKGLSEKEAIEAIVNGILR